MKLQSSVPHGGSVTSAPSLQGPPKAASLQRLPAPAAHLGPLLALGCALSLPPSPSATSLAHTQSGPDQKLHHYVLTYCQHHKQQLWQWRGGPSGRARSTRCGLTSTSELGPLLQPVSSAAAQRRRQCRCFVGVQLKLSKFEGTHHILRLRRHPTSYYLDIESDPVPRAPSSFHVKESIARAARIHRSEQPLLILLLETTPIPSISLIQRRQDVASSRHVGRSGKMPHMHPTHISTV